MSHFWNHKIVSTALVFTFISLNAWAQKVEQVKDARSYLPQLSSPADLQTYEGYLQNILPAVFQKGSFTIGVDKNISQEQIFLKKMNEPKIKELYNSELPRRNPYQRVEITTFEQVYEKTENLQPQIQKGLAQNFQTLTEQYSTPESRVQKMSELVFMLNGQNSNGLLIGLVQSLPPELKGQAFKLDFASKLEFIKNNLTNENFKANFKSTHYNVENITVEQMLGEVQRLVTVESHIAEFSLFTYWKNKGFTTADMGKLKNIDLFKDLDYLSQFKLEANELNKVKEAIKSTTQNFIKNNSMAGVQTLVSNPKDRITIREVSPYLGQYRGEISNNCSTAMAFGFAYSPAERTYILEKNGQVVFSISATEVKMNNQKTLYIHEMGQLKASPDLAEFVMRALYGARHELGFENIAGGQKGMHYSQFGSRMQQSSKNQEMVPIEYIDPETRTAIGELMVKIAGPMAVKYGLQAEYSRQHDLPQHHKLGYIFEPKDKYETEISTTIKLQAPEKLPTSLNLGLVAFAPHEKRLLEKPTAVVKRPQAKILKCEMLFH